VAAVAALLALGAGNASAQSSMSSPAGPGTAAMQPPAAPVGPASNAAPMKDPLSSEDISQIEGVSVAGSDGSSIGKVSTVLMNPSTKKVDRLVVAEGGVLGVGAHDVALPMDAFRWNSQNRNFVIQKTADDLKAMPEWKQPQLAEAPSGASSTSGVAAGLNAGAPAGAISPQIAPSAGNANQPAH
jgi:sporulation protein YlmC with PRC-barrel domain